MHLGIYLIALVIGIIVLLLLIHSNENDDRLPCQYLDSINITDGIRQPDDSIQFNGMTFTKDQYARVDYVLENGTTYRMVAPYIRGCVCSLKSCVRLCCPLGSYYQNRSCHRHNDVRHLETQILDENKQTKSIVLDSRFAYVSDRSCNRRYIADEFQIVHTGSILFEGKHLSHWEYCLNPVPNDEEGQSFDQNEKLALEAQVCPESEQSIALAVGMALSVPFIAITIFVYIFLAELQNLYGKCLINYLACLTFGYIILGVIQLNGISSILSESIGYVVYFIFVTSFCWISVISVELYLNFRTPDRKSENVGFKQFTVYVIYVWCISLFLTMAIYVLDTHFRSIHSEDSLKTCFVDYKNSTQCSYFYMPIWLLFAINQTFFMLTGLRIQRTKQRFSRENARQTIVLIMASRDLSHPNEIHNEDKFALYLRLHIVTCLTWVCKGLALLSADKLVIYSNVSYAVQGLVIFVLFVMNRQILHIISERWQQFKGKSILSIGNKNVEAPVDPAVR